MPLRAEFVVLCHLLLPCLADATDRLPAKFRLYKLDLDKYPLARCLDGSPGAFHFLPSSSPADSRKWTILHNGGGWCSMDVPDGQEVMVDHCHARSQTVLGSSSNYRDMSSDTFSDFMSVDPAQSPLMHSWNKVSLVYCDGGSFSGRSVSGPTVLGRRLHFQGSYILEAVMETLKERFDLGSASDVVVAGYSAGGLATILQVDNWRRSLPRSVFVAALVDSGFFLDWSGSKPEGATSAYGAAMRSNYHTFNASVPAECVARRLTTGRNAEACYFAEHAAPFVETPLFALQSIVDSWQLDNILGSDADEGQVQEFSLAMQARLKESLLDGRALRAGSVDSCVHHCGLWCQISVHGTPGCDAFTTWYLRQRKAWSDGAAPEATPAQWQPFCYPCHECCGGPVPGDVPALRFDPRRRMSSAVVI
eukprot:gb/GFBE01064408.1/.p1 GENE.gb/GFBE01064408.1/~~gb/GFBE01064408.1/.p1  ORF type:complete len:421 (+),score=68.56 gb/GFBE01064408.1/:1-1263(+)